MVYYVKCGFTTYNNIQVNDLLEATRQNPIDDNRKY